MRALAVAARGAHPAVVDVDPVLRTAGDPAAPARVLTAGGRFVSMLGATGMMASYTPAKLAGLLAKVAPGELTVPMTGSYSLSDATAALTVFGRGKLGKIVVTVP